MQPVTQVRDRATVPLATLLDEPAFGAALLSPAPAELAADPELRARVRATPVASSIVIELDDPGAYMLPGDLLLITGLAITGDPVRDAAYAARLHAAGVSALVFGIEPVHAEVPAGLVAACQALGFPLVALPEHVYFAAVTSALNRALETERTRALEAMNTLARRLTEASLQHRPAQRLVEELAQQGTGWAVLHIEDETYRSGELPAGLPLESTIAELRERLAAQPRARGAQPTVFTTVTAGAGADAGTEYEVAAHEAGPRRARSRVSGDSAILLLGRAPRLTRTDLTALQLAANLVGLVLQLPAAQSMAVDQLLMHLMTDSPATTIPGAERDRFARLLSNSFGGSARRAHAVIAIRDPGRALGNDPVPGDGTVASDAAWLRRLLHTPFVEHRARRLRAFVGAPPTPGELERARELGWLLAVSAAHDFGDLPAAMREAEEHARAARHLRQHIDGAAEPASGMWPLGAAADPAVARAAAAQWLAPLLGPAHAEPRRALRSWLRHHGAWDRTARDLELHRNTVRRLIAEAQSLLGRDLEDPLERARVLLALTALDADE
ncbi:PucR family transcriptional regulator [Leucobacter chromiireducens]|uniref:PucR family transcriptional regulator n=1 Tax=Leucobacter chromiireducens TaxID=283877 RepID=UPI000F636F4E|nr:PucR family transcriptional regulator [Leucobacter chromiireducens]